MQYSLFEIGKLQLVAMVAEGAVEGEALEVRVGHMDPRRKILVGTVRQKRFVSARQAILILSPTFRFEGVSQRESVAGAANQSFHRGAEDLARKAAASVDVEHLCARGCVRGYPLIITYVNGEGYLFGREFGGKEGTDRDVGETSI
jgi:hypothetical protein